MPNKKALEDWVRSSPLFRSGKSKNYSLEGVVFELQDGSQYAVPFYLFAKKEQVMLKSGWDAWLASHAAVPVPPAPGTNGGSNAITPAVGLTGKGEPGEAGLPKPAEGITANAAAAPIQG